MSDVTETNTPTTDTVTVPQDYSDVSRGSAWLENWFQNNPGTIPPVTFDAYTSNKGYTNLSLFYNANRMGDHTLEGLSSTNEAQDGNAHFWSEYDQDGWVSRKFKEERTDPLTGIKAQFYQVQTRGGWLEGYTNEGSQAVLIFPDGQVKIKNFTGKSGGKSWGRARDWFNSFSEKAQEVGRPEWVGSDGMTRSVSDLTESFETFIRPPDLGDTQEDVKEDTKELKAQIASDISMAKQETEDISAQQQLMAQQQVARQSGAQQRALSAQLAAQTGMSPEETSMMLSRGTEGLARMQADIAQQGNVLKMKSLSDLSKFGMTAGLTAEELGAKLQGIASQRATTMAGLENQFNIAQLQSDTQRYGMDLDYRSALRQAEAQQAAGEAQGWGGLAGGIGQVAMAKAMVKCIPEETMIDTEQGPVAIENLRAGDIVIGFNGDAIPIMQKHEYNEDPDSKRFLNIVFEDGTTVDLCDMHRIENIRSKDLSLGDEVGGKIIKAITWYSGVNRSYDLLTEDGGYRISGVFVNSMIPEMNQLIKVLNEEVQ